MLGSEALMPDPAVESILKPQVTALAMNTGLGYQIPCFKNNRITPINIFYLKTFDSEYTNDRGHKRSPFGCLETTRLYLGVAYCPFL